MKPRTVRDLLISLGLTAGLGAANPACGGALTTPNPGPNDGAVGNPLPDTGVPIETSNPPPPDAAPWPDAVTDPLPLDGGGGIGGRGGVGGFGGVGGTGVGGFGGVTGFGGGNIFPPRPDASGGTGGSSDADADVVDGAADGSEGDGHEVD